MVIGATAILIVAVFAVRGTNLAGHFTDALGVARALETHGQWYGALFAIVLLDARIIGASAVTLSTSYAFGDVFGIKHSLHRRFREAKPFYASYTAMVVVAAAHRAHPRRPARADHHRVQALAGVLLPSAAVFLLLLCNDREVLGPWMNPRWLNILASVIIGVLLVLSGTLVVTTLFTNLDASKVAIWIAVGLVAAGRPGRGVVLADQEPPAPAAAAPAGHDVRGRAAGLAHAAARPAQAGRVVHRDEGRPADPARLPGDFRPAADRQGRPAGRRLTPPTRLLKVPF